MSPTTSIPDCRMPVAIAVPCMPVAIVVPSFAGCAGLLYFCLRRKFTWACNCSGNPPHQVWKSVSTRDPAFHRRPGLPRTISMLAVGAGVHLEFGVESLSLFRAEYQPDNLKK